MYIPPLYNNPPSLVLNEIMNNPLAVNDSYGEWIEIANAGWATELLSQTNSYTITTYHITYYNIFIQ